MKSFDEQQAAEEVRRLNIEGHSPVAAVQSAFTCWESENGLSCLRNTP